MIPSKHFVQLGVAALAFGSSITMARADYVFPADANIYNVKAAPYNAKGDGVTDDTAAIKQCISDALNGPSRYAAPPFIYFPSGTYIISDTLESRVSDTAGWSYGWRSGFIVFGQSRSNTVLKLKNNLAAFMNPGTPKAVIKTGSENPHDAGGGGNQAFRHSIVNLTVDTGSGNSGAVGIDFVAHNRGCIEDVTIRSGDANRIGVNGIRMTRAWPGPAMIKNVSISGFNHAIELSHYQYSMTFEHITLSNQLVSGVKNVQNVLNLRGLTSTNSVPVFDMTSNHGQLTLIDAQFSGGVSGNAAIKLAGAAALLRNVRSSGYGKIVDDTSTANKDVTAGSGTTLLEEYTLHSVKTLHGAPSDSLNLPVEETPTYNTTDLSKWANVEHYGATKDNGGDDDAAGIQAAIDSGKEIIYLPNGDYSVGSTIIIRGNVKKIMGLQSGISRKSSTVNPVIRFDSTTANAVVIEHIRTNTIEHNSSKTLSIRHCDMDYRNTANGTGKVFFEDTIGKPVKMLHPQKMWARQLNCEFGTAPSVENHGGTAWILGMKHEGQDHTLIETRNGGTTELLGGLVYPLSADAPATLPAFLLENSKGAFSFTMNGSKTYPLLVRSIKNGVTQDLLRSQIPGRGMADLVTAYDRPLPSPWTGDEVGSTASLGSNGYQSGVFEIEGSGEDIWGSTDEFRFVHRTVTGDCTITARVASLENTDPFAKAGVMIRESMAGNSRHAFSCLTPQNGAKFYYRTSTGSTTSVSTNSGITAPYWVRLIRSGNTFTAQRSSNGTSWTTVGSTTISMAATVEVGLAVTSHSDGVKCTAEFGNVTVSTSGSASIEAENYENLASTSSPLEVETDGSASGGEHLRAQYGTADAYDAMPGSTLSGTPITGYADCGFSLDAAATVDIWFRARAFTLDGEAIGSNDSFRFDVYADGEGATNWNGGISSVSWQWHKAYAKPLGTGDYTLRVGYRETGSLLDRIYISTDGNMPQS